MLASRKVEEKPKLVLLCRNEGRRWNFPQSGLTTDGSQYYHWILVIKMRALRIGTVAASVWLAAMTIAAGIASAQTAPSTVDGYIAAAKVAAGTDWAGTFLRLCIPPPAAGAPAAGAGGRGGGGRGAA